MEKYLKLEIERLEMTIAHTRKQLKECKYDLDQMKGLINKIEKLEHEQYVIEKIQHMSEQDDEFYHGVCCCLEDELTYLDQIINQ